jgi:hypothetical protein
MLQALKVIGLGTLIWFGTFLTIIVWTVAYGIYMAMRVASGHTHGANVEVGHATGLSAIVFAIVFNPIPYLIILAAYGVAYWIVVGRKRKGLTAQETGTS